MPTVFVIASLLATLTVHAQLARPLVRVHVFTEDSGERDELANRNTSVKDLAGALAAKKKVFAGATDEENAQLIIEVVARAVTIPKVVFGLGPRPGQSTIGAGPAKAAELRVRLRTRPGEIVDFKNKNKAADTPRGWKSAAEDIADQIERWQLAQVVRAPLVLQPVAPHPF